MTKTARDVVTRALRRIRVIGSNETAPADLYEEALAEYEGFHHWLLKEFRTDVRWNSDSVPDDKWTFVAGWFAGDLCKVLPCSNEDRAIAEAGASVAEIRLREILARQKLKTVEVNYF